MKYPFNTIVLIAMVATAFGQQKADNTYIVDLRNQLSSATTDTAKITTYHKLAEAIPDSALEFETKALSLSLAAKNTQASIESYTNLGAAYRNRSDYYKAIELYKKAIALSSSQEHPHLVQTFLELGIAYLRMAEYDSAERSLLRGLEINTTKKDSYLEASIYNMMGNVLKDRNDYKQAIEYYLKSVTLFKEIKDKAGITQAVSNIGNIEYLLGNYDKALEYAKESLRVAEEIDKKSSIAYSNRLIGRIYRKQQKLDDALAAYNKAAEIYRSLGAKRDVSETYYNTGNIYFEKNDLEKAIQYYKDALTIQKKIPDTLNMAYSYSAIAQASYELHRYNLTLTYMDSAARSAERKKLPYVMLDVHDYRSMVYAAQHNFERAYLNHLSYADLKDSLAQQENRLAAQEVENKYQSKAKEEEIKVLQTSNQLAALQLQKKNAQRNYLIGLSALAVILLGVLYNRYKIKLKTTQKLQELDEMKSRFFTNLSHEFRTPLSLIIGPLQKRLANISDTEEKDEIELMIRNARHLSSLINQMLDLSKLESGKMKLQVREENILQMLKLIIASFASYANHKKIQLVSDIDQCDVASFVDREKLEQVIGNLLSNALKFTPAGGQVKFTARVANGQLEVSIKDNGIGISAEKISQVFDRFYQADDSSTRLTEGSGIGLALCKELVELHKGRITVESTPGLGSEFRFSVPVRKDSYQNEELATTVESPSQWISGDPVSDTAIRNTSSPNDNSKPLILVVEDNKDMSDFIHSVLHHQYRVAAAPDGNKGIEEALNFIPDLIITDLMMPNMSGLTMSQTLKNNVPTSHIPVIMLTAKADMESRLEGLQTGADDYLTKPFDSRELLVRVQNLIRQRKHLQEIFREKVTIQPQALNREKPNEKFLAQLVDALEENYSSPLFGVDQLAEDMGVSRMQLHRKLKALTDESPGDFIRQFRLQRARQLLLAGGMQVSEVAYETGFNNLSHFTKLFKEFAGSTPTEFINQHRAANPPLPGK